jgi:hypothetical protein
MPNCWEYKKCGRELGGVNARLFGICPASIDIKFDGVHNGISAGRACWIVAGTMCEGLVMGTFAKKYRDCIRCDFYGLVEREESRDFLMLDDLLAIRSDSTLQSLLSKRGYDLNFLSTELRKIQIAPFPDPPR